MGLPGAPPTPLTDHQLLIRSILANIGAAAAWIVIILLVLGNIFASLPEAPWFWRSAGAAFSASFILWLAMWIEYFRERPSNKVGSNLRQDVATEVSATKKNGSW